MLCEVCGKDSEKNICKQCLCLMTTKNFSKEDAKKFKNMSSEYNCKSIADFKENLRYFSKDTKIEYNCEICNKKVQSRFKNIKNKENLTCRQCSLEKSNLEKYGVKNVFSLVSTKTKIIETNNKKYGSDYYLQTEDARELRKRDQFLKAKELLENKLQNYSKVSIEDERIRPKDSEGHFHFANVKCICKKCGHEYSTNIRRAQRCDICYPEDWMNGVSKLEKSIVEYIKSIYSGQILENIKNVIYPKELDIYLPELKIAFEIDGDYWHGCDNISLFKELLLKSDEKQKLCYEKGIRLITLKECDYIDRPEVFKRFIKDCITPRTRIFARKCDIKEIDTKTAKNFCNYYHVNGYRGGFLKYGLYYNNELLCVAIFGKHKKYGYECIRLCYKTGISIIGGWEKIQKHFGKQFLHYVNLQYFPGKNITGTGFRLKKDDIILSRVTMQKNTQLKKYCPNYNASKSDLENAIDNGFIVIFDCGNDKRIYNFGII